MKEQYKDLGKVSLTVDGYWSVDKEYEIITIVNDENDNSYISKKDVPKGTELTNTEYWQPIGIKTNNDSIKVYKLNILNELTINSEKIIIDEALTPIEGNNIVFPTINDILLDDENNESSTILFTSKTDAADEGGYFIYYIYKNNINNKLIIKIINIGGEDYDNNIKVLSVNSYDVTSINNFINVAKNITFIASGDGIDSTVESNNNKVSFKLPWITGEQIIEDGISKDTEFIIPVATTTAAGVISKEDKSKVDTIGTSEDSPNPNGTAFARIKDLKNNAVGKKVAGGGEIFNNSEYNTANGENSHAEGRGSEANGNMSHAEGSGSANGAFSHAEGRADANGDTAHAEGSSIADGDASHAEGYSTNSKGDFSHTEGYYTITNNINEHASGRFNVSNTSGSDSNNSWKGNNVNTLFSIGNGTKENNRKNAFEVKQDGTILIQKPTTSEVINLQDYLLNRFILRSQKGIAGGVATLDSTGKIPSSQLPAGIDDVKDIIYGSNSLSTLISSSNWTSAKIGDRGLVYKSSGGTEDGIYVKTESGYTKEEFQKDLIYIIDTEFICGDITFNTNTCWRWSGTQLAQTNSGIVIGNVEGTAFDGGKGANIENDINKLKNTIEYGDLLTPVYKDNSSESSVEFEFKTINKDFETNPIKAVIAINSATTKTAGVMSAADKTKLNDLTINKYNALTVEALDQGSDSTTAFTVNEQYTIPKPGDLLQSPSLNGVFLSVATSFSIITITYYLKNQITKLSINKTNNTILSKTVINVDDLNDKVNELDNEPSLHDLWLAAGATYQKETNTYTLNGVTGLTKDDMLISWRETNNMLLIGQQMWRYQAITCKTNFLAKGPNGNTGQNDWTSIDENNFTRCFYLAGNLLTLRVCGADTVGSNYGKCIPKIANGMFYACSARKILGIIQMNKCTDVTDMFLNNTKIEDIKLYKVIQSISFSQAPNLSVDDTKDSTLGFLITNAANTSPIIITLHTDAFNKVPETLIQKAQDKQISIAHA